MSRTPRQRWATRSLCVAALLIAVLAPGAASAQGGDNYPPGTTVTTGDPCATDPGLSASAVCGTSVVSGQSASAGDTLAFTGGDIALLTVLGLGAALGGVALVLLARRARSAAV